jgi:hypothetical protein
VKEGCCIWQGVRKGRERREREKGEERAKEDRSDVKRGGEEVASVASSGADAV